MAKRQKNRQLNGQKTEEQTTQWPNEKGQKDNQRSTKHMNKYRVTRTPLQTGGEFLYSGRISRSLYTSATRRT